MKPSWKNSPKWAQWLAQDADKEWRWHEFESTFNGIAWQSKGKIISTSKCFKTLEKRPEGV